MPFPKYPSIFQIFVAGKTSLSSPTSDRYKDIHVKTEAEMGQVLRSRSHRGWVAETFWNPAGQGDVWVGHLCCTGS